MAPLYCVVMVIAYLTGINAVSGVSGKDGVRASYTFGDPNLAGNYLVVSLFMMAACRRPRTPWVRHAGYLVVLTAVLFTGSNGAMLTLVLGSVACWVLSRARLGAAKGVSALVVSALIAITFAVWVIPNVSLDGVRQATADSIPLLRDSVGRSGSSTSERSSIVSEGFALFLGGDTTGYGPARTKATLQNDQAPYVKEAHNDYLATLLERGVIGSVGLVLLIVAIGLRCMALAGSTPLPPEFASSVPRPWLLVAIAPVMATAAAFYEVLHFRHLWTWLGIVAALVLALQDARREQRERETTP
jgi:O-antigen ligase